MAPSFTIKLFIVILRLCEILVLLLPGVTGQSHLLVGKLEQACASVNKKVSQLHLLKHCFHPIG